ncbi:hypothetical protein [Paenibacillus sp. BC26]|uniref:hypothetical protein n=1 Tax=Paenibacillus sp. BC26 TaxID=1881032 RepID=UPI0008DFCEF6|nr:hypothetical protein [Paenibacillus sp. BC26]SFT09943.1 hypothetical protein SAMN05428962_4384 [Paenibacillus sp. BC26]
MKKWLHAIGFICALIALTTGIIISLKQTEITVARVYGSGTSPEGNSILVGLSGDRAIPCSYEQLNTISDDSYLNITYSVVYKQNRWFNNNPHIEKILRFERPFPDKQNAQVHGFYYRLVDESLETINADTSVFTRLYEKREDYNNLADLVPQYIVIPHAETIKQARQWVEQHHPEFLQLIDQTVVEASMLNRWKQDAYEQVYSNASPEGYSTEDFIGSTT